MIAAGIDPGKRGAVVVCDGPTCLEIVRFEDILGADDWTDKADAVADALGSLLVRHRIGLVAMERDAGRPKEGAASARTCGRGWGLVRGVLAGRVTVLVPTARVWTRAMHRDIPGDDPKARSIYLATAAGVELTRGKETKPRDGIADAYCLARYAQTHPLAGAP